MHISEMGEGYGVEVGEAGVAEVGGGISFWMLPLEGVAPVQVGWGLQKGRS